VVVVGTTIGTITDADGNYSLRIPAKSQELSFSYIGYKTQQLPVPWGNTLNVKMTTETQELSEMVVVGYGTQRKSDLTGSVSSVSAKDFNSGLISSPEQLITERYRACRSCRTVVANVGKYHPHSGRSFAECQQRPIDRIDGSHWKVAALWKLRQFYEPDQPE
jgi:hypothetical protein